MNKITITIEVPEGVVPEVQYSTGAPPLVQEVPGQEFPPFAAGASTEPICKVHHRTMRNGRNGWYCSAKMPNGDWCTERA